MNRNVCVTLVTRKFFLLVKRSMAMMHHTPNGYVTPTVHSDYHWDGRVTDGVSKKMVFITLYG